MTFIGQIILVLFLILLAVWRRDIFFYFLAAPVALTFGLMWRSHYNTPDGLTVSLALMATGLYCFVMGIWNVVRKGR